MMIDAIRALEQKLRTTGRFDEADSIRELCCGWDTGDGWYATYRLAREMELLVLASGSSAGLCRARRIGCPALGPLEAVTAWATTPDVVEYACCRPEAGQPA